VAELIVRRIIAGGAVLVLVSMVVFGLVLLTPGDAAVRVAGESASAEQVQEIREQLGLDLPVHRQYSNWAGNALSGDLGKSIITHQPVLDAIKQRLPATLSLTLGALLVTLLISIPAGIISSMRRGTLLDRSITGVTSLGVAIPSFWLGLILIAYVGRHLGFLPASRYVPLTQSPRRWAFSLVLPSIALGMAPAAEVTRQLRSALNDVMQQDFIRTAKAKGLSRYQIVAKHALKNAAVPVVTVIGIQFTLLISTAVIVEQVFSFQGIGTLAYEAASDRDIPMIQGVVVFTTLIVIVVNFLVEISYGLFNPKVRT
jgi:peptide/nickel transport system permease protein